MCRGSSYPSLEGTSSQGVECEWEGKGVGLRVLGRCGSYYHVGKHHPSGSTTREDGNTSQKQSLIDSIKR